MPTSEIYAVNENGTRGAYSGYARLDNNGNLLGTYGGYNRGGQRATAGNRGPFNYSRGGGSVVENAIRSAGLRQAARRRRAYGGLR